jgi:hypothetical protein
MSLISWPLQQALFSRLSTALAPVAVYDDAPTTATFPYVTLGEQTSTGSGDKTSDAEELTVTLHAWSRKAGRKEVKDLLERIHSALHAQELTVAGFDPVTLRHEFSNDFLEAETSTKHGVIRFGGVVTSST